MAAVASNFSLLQAPSQGVEQDDGQLTVQGSSQVAPSSQSRYLQDLQLTA